MRLIDADKLKNTIDILIETADKLEDDSIHKTFLESFKHIIDMQNTVEPIKHGYWKNEVVCSECGFYRQYTRSNNPMIGKFCPNCGAKMNEKE